MKKLSTKDVYLLFFLGIVGFLAIYYLYIFTPIKSEYDTLVNDKEALKIQVSANNTESEKKHLSKLQNDLLMKQEELSKTENQKILSKSEQDILLKYIGEEAKRFNINLIKFEEKEINHSLSYNILPFDIKARGTSKELILFMNSLYGIFDFFYIEDLYLRKVSLLPTTEKLSEAKKDKNPGFSFNWSEDYLELVHLEIPGLKTTDTASIQQPNERPFELAEIETALQLDFKLNFLSSK